MNSMTRFFYKILFSRKYYIVCIQDVSCIPREYWHHGWIPMYDPVYYTLPEAMAVMKAIDVLESRYIRIEHKGGIKVR